MARKTLLSGIITTGLSTAYDWPGGPGQFSVDIGGVGAVQLEHTPDGTNWFAVHIFGSTSIVQSSTADTSLGFSLPAATRIRAAITTASTSSGVSAWVT